MAAQGADLKGVVSFHGSLTLIQPPNPGEIKAKILVLHAGGSDKFATPAQIEKFKNELDAAGADYKFIVYPGAMHSFSNPQATALGKSSNCLWNIMPKRITVMEGNEEIPQDSLFVNRDVARIPERTQHVFAPSFILFILQRNFVNCTPFTSRNKQL
jgi:hypothetical protein